MKDESIISQTFSSTEETSCCHVRSDCTPLLVMDVRHAPYTAMSKLSIGDIIVTRAQLPARSGMEPFAHESFRSPAYVSRRRPGPLDDIAHQYCRLVFTSTVDYARHFPSNGNGYFNDRTRGLSRSHCCCRPAIFISITTVSTNSFVMILISRLKAFRCAFHAAVDTAPHASRHNPRERGVTEPEPTPEPEAYTTCIQSLPVAEPPVIVFRLNIVLHLKLAQILMGRRGNDVAQGTTGLSRTKPIFLSQPRHVRHSFLPHAATVLATSGLF